MGGSRSIDPRRIEGPDPEMVAVGFRAQPVRPATTGAPRPGLHRHVRLPGRCDLEEARALREGRLGQAPPGHRRGPRDLRRRGRPRLHPRLGRTTRSVGALGNRAPTAGREGLTSQPAWPSRLAKGWLRLAHPRRSAGVVLPPPTALHPPGVRQLAPSQPSDQTASSLPLGSAK